jgi:glucosyl-dolichyl phosphate glucuronosyltransferase
MPGVYAIAQRGAEVRPLRPDEPLVGANMAFRTAILREHPFNTVLGPRPDLVMRGEDDELGDRLRRRGLSGVWVGNACVRHYIPPERLNAAYIWQWHVGLGRTYLRKNGIAYEGTRLFGVPRWLYRQYVQEALKAALLSPLKGPRWFAAFQRSAILRGSILETRQRGPGR